MPKNIELQGLKEDVKEIRENHIPHLSTQIAEIRADISWLKKSVYIVASSSVGAFFTALANLFK